MPITGFPSNSSNSSNTQTDAVTSVDKQPNGQVNISRNNNQQSQSFQIETSIDDIELDTNGNVNASFTNQVGNSTLFAIPDAVEDITIVNNQLQITKNFSSNYTLDLPKEIITWSISTNISNSYYYAYDGHIWKCDTSHTSTSTFDYTKFTLYHSVYVTTVNGDYTIPVLKEGVKIEIKINAGSLNSINIICDNLKISQAVTIQLLSANANEITINFTHNTLTASGNAIQSPNISKLATSIKNIILVKNNSANIIARYDSIGRNEDFMTVAGTTGTATWKTLNNTPPASDINYNIYTSPFGNIALNAIPLTNTLCGTTSYSSQNGIVAGSSNNSSASLYGAVMAGIGNNISGNGRVCITGSNASTANVTPYSYRESGYYDASTGYACASDVAIITKKMSDATAHLTSISTTVKKTLNAITGRASIGTHEVYLVGQSNTDLFIRRFVVTYSNVSGTYTLIDHLNEYSYTSTGASSWSYSVTDVADGNFKIIPTGGDFWYARVNSIYNNR